MLRLVLVLPQLLILGLDVAVLIRPDRGDLLAQIHHRRLACAGALSDGRELVAAELLVHDWAVGEVRVWDGATERDACVVVTQTANVRGVVMITGITMLIV